MTEAPRTDATSSSSQPTPEAVRLLQFLRWAGRAGFGIALFFAVMYALFASPASLLFGLLALAASAVSLYARSLARRNRVEAAMLVGSSVFWAMGLLVSARGGISLAPGVVMALWPVVLGVAYASGRTLLRVILISTAICALAAGLSTLEGLVPSTLSEQVYQRIVAFVTPVLFAVCSLSLWHSGSILREALAEARATNRALAESERTLERKVEERTGELQKAVAEISDLNELARIVNSTLDLDRVLETMNTGLGKLFRFDQMGLFLLDEAGERLVLDRALGREFDAELQRRLKTTGIPLDEERSASVLALRDRRRVLVPKVGAEQLASLSPTDRMIYERNPMKALLLSPLEVEGSVIGTIFFANTRSSFDLGEDDLAAIERHLTTLATAIRNARLFAEAERSRAAAEEANQTKSAFLANMSHELRTPLNAIIGYSEMLQDEARDDGNDEYLPDLGKILTSGRHLLELINGVLDLAKIESGKMEVYLEDFDVVELVRGVEGTIQPLVRKNANQLEVSCPDGLGSMHSDVTKLRQVLFNLLSNASKFTRNGSIRLEVERSRAEDEEWLRFRVTDSGIGMNEDQLARVFEEFSQADTTTTKEYGGTGLGLPISKRFCEMLGGSIVATSEPGRGSTFEMRLPATAPTPVEEATPEAAIGVGAPDAVTQVLVIDDDPAARDLIGRFLAGEGFGVRTAASGEEGLRLAREQPPDIITLDVVMPQMDGWAVLGELKADPCLANVPVILVSVSDERNLGYALGASEYLTKPVDWGRLGAVLQRHADAGLALVIDDEPDARDVLRRGLERAGWSVTEAENGRVGLERVAEAVPDLILLDLMMPVMDGFEFVAELRRREAWRSIPILVITAKEITKEDRARLEGCVARILQKGSYQRGDLVREIRSLVNSNPRQGAEAS